LCGEKELKSNVPSWRWLTGISSGASSACKTSVKLESAETREDSGRWKAGRRLEIMEGVRMRTEGLGVEDVRSGRKVWRVRIGVRTRVFRRSFKVEG
jgi:hypothetical protein